MKEEISTSLQSPLVFFSFVAKGQRLTRFIHRLQKLFPRLLRALSVYELMVRPAIVPLRTF